MPTSSPFIETYSGRAFRPLDANVDDIVIEDIAHALSNQCRFSGHTREFYCPTPEQRILTADLRWVPAGDLKTGDELLSFDEFAHELGQAGKPKRRFRYGEVTHTEAVKRRVLRLEMADGSDVRCSSEHPWLVAMKLSRNQKWQTAEEIREAVAAGRKRYMHKFIAPWKEETSRQAGWLAGMADGEGYFSSSNRGGVQFGIAQRQGLLFDMLKETLGAFAFDARYSDSPQGTYGDVRSLQLCGGWREIARFLGSIRPARLLSSFVKRLREGEFTKQMNGHEPTEIVRVYDEGEAWVAGLSTSGRTYICEGFGAHNCVAEHSVRVAELLRVQRYSKQVQLWGLLHDASEAYLVDIPAPLKAHPSFSAYREFEAALMAKICEAFDLPKQQPTAVSKADAILLATEARDLMPCRPEHWRTLKDVPLALRITPMSSADARFAFLARYLELFPYRLVRS